MKSMAVRPNRENLKCVVASGSRERERAREWNASALHPTPKVITSFRGQQCVPFSKRDDSVVCLESGSLDFCKERICVKNKLVAFHHRPKRVNNFIDLHACARV